MGWWGGGEFIRSRVQVISHTVVIPDTAQKLSLGDNTHIETVVPMRKAYEQINNGELLQGVRGQRKTLGEHSCAFAGVDGNAQCIRQSGAGR